MAKRSRKRKCKNCKDLFRPDPRNINKQKYCRKPECRKASKAASQARWLAKEENRDHFRGPENVQRVQEWRKKNPGYWRRKGAKGRNALQDHSIEKEMQKQGVVKHLTPDALQDHLTAQHAVLIGLIANLTGCALQDDIVKATRNLQKLGTDILNSPTTTYQGGDYAIENPYLSQPSSSGP